MIVVLGGTGFVARHLAAALAGAAEPVRLTTSDPRAAARWEAAGAAARRPAGGASGPRQPQWAYADVRDAGSLQAAFAGARAVVDLVASIHRPTEFPAVYQGGMRNLVHAARRAGARRILHIASLAGEESRRDPRRGYLYWRERARETLCESGLDFTVFESSMLFGPGDQHLSALGLVLKWMPCIPIPGAAAVATRFQPLWVGDMVTCLLRALDDPAAAGRIFPLGGPEVWSYGELLELVAAAVGRRPPILLVPRWSAGLVLRALARGLPYSPVASAMIELIGTDSMGDSRASWRHFGITPARLADHTAYLRQVGGAELRAWRRRTGARPATEAAAAPPPRPAGLLPTAGLDERDGRVPAAPRSSMATELEPS